MKPKYIIVVFATLLCCSVWAGMQRYCCAEKEMVADMNQALAQTLRHKQEAWITPDTIRDYRSNLRLAVLRRQSLICYADDVDPKTVASSKMAWGRGGRRVVFRGYANCSVGTGAGPLRPAHAAVAVRLVAALARRLTDVDAPSARSDCRRLWRPAP